MGLLIDVIVIFAIIGIAYWVLTQIPLPPPLRIVVVAVVGLVAILALLSLVGGGFGTFGGFGCGHGGLLR